jgi:hypothetical protein
LAGSRQKAENKRQKAESKRQKVESRRQKAESENREQKAVRGPLKKQGSGLRTVDPSFYPIYRCCLLLSAFCFLRTLPTCAKILSLRKGGLVHLALSQHIYD